MEQAFGIKNIRGCYVLMFYIFICMNLIVAYETLCQYLLRSVKKGSALPKNAGLRREANLTPLAIWDLTWLLPIEFISDSPLTATSSVESGHHNLVSEPRFYPYLRVSTCD